MFASMNLGNLSRPPMFLFFFKSRDLLEWEGYNKPILTPGSGGFDDKMIYHGDILVDNGIVYIWYSGVSTEDRYSIGLVKGEVKDKCFARLRSDNIAGISSLVRSE
ncbi:MAG: hypothetical protein LM601_11835 [Candidatus Verstraetearchaeota archaeon]|nr:hypothetical protein [Candidatus Verstraetearchaeota archaeon]